MQFIRKAEKDGLGGESEGEEIDSGDDDSPSGNNFDENGTEDSGAGAEGQPGLCQLSGSLMAEPIKTPYGHVFDRQALADWLSFSETDPICGQPLKMEECVPYAELANQIFAGQLAAMSGAVLGVEPVAEVVSSSGTQKSPAEAERGLLGDLPELGGEKAKKEKKEKTSI